MYPIYIYNTSVSEFQEFRSVSLYDHPFSSYSDFETRASNDPNALEYYKVKGTQHVCY